MDPHVIALDAKRDREFLEQQRIDPVMKTLLEPGDRVVVCAHCRLVFREYTWAEIKGKFGHGTSTLPYLPVDTVHFSRSTTREGRPPAERPAPTGAAPSYASPPPEPRHVPTREWQPANGPGADAGQTSQPPSAAQQAWSAVVNSARDFSNEAPRAASALFNGARRVVNEAPEAWSQIVNRTRQFSDRVRGRSNRTDSSDAEVLELQEIPFELEKIPFELREMKLY
jgi:hypothetical protein